MTHGGARKGAGRPRVAPVGEAEVVSAVVAQATYDRLRVMARVSRRSLSALVRQILDDAVSHPTE